MHVRDITVAVATVAMMAGLGLVSGPFPATSPMLNRVSSVAGIVLIVGGIVVAVAIIIRVAFEKPEPESNADDPSDPEKRIVDA